MPDIKDQTIIELKNKIKDLEYKVEKLIELGTQQHKTIKLVKQLVEMNSKQIESNANAVSLYIKARNGS